MTSTAYQYYQGNDTAGVISQGKESYTELINKLTRQRS